MIQTKQAIVLLAGEGKRLQPFTLSQPKCFAQIGGTPILENALRALALNGCEGAQLVVGHKADVIRDVIKGEFAGVQIAYIENHDYQRTNSMYSLALGMRDLQGPCWVIEGDVFIEPRLLSLRPTGEISWYVDSSTRQFDGAYVEIGANDIAEGLAVVRDPSSLKPSQSKSVGILHLSTRGFLSVRSWLEDAIMRGRQNDYYDLILGDNMGSKMISTVDVAGCKWFEVDNQQDLAMAEKIFSRRP
jgi:choline kinase